MTPPGYHGSNQNQTVIPPMTDPLGQQWRQPDSSKILVDDSHALMDRAAFDTLAEYSATIPTGVYPGKMWKRHNGVHDPRCKPEDIKWMLGWYGLSDKDDDFCSVNFREILLL